MSRRCAHPAPTEAKHPCRGGVHTPCPRPTEVRRTSRGLGGRRLLRQQRPAHRSAATDAGEEAAFVVREHVAGAVGADTDRAGDLLGGERRRRGLQYRCDLPLAFVATRDLMHLWIGGGFDGDADQPLIVLAVAVAVGVAVALTLAGTLRFEVQAEAAPAGQLAEVSSAYFSRGTPRSAVSSSAYPCACK